MSSIKRKDTTKRKIENSSNNNSNNDNIKTNKMKKKKKKNSSHIRLSVNDRDDDEDDQNDRDDVNDSEDLSPININIISSDCIDRLRKQLKKSSPYPHIVIGMIDDECWYDGDDDDDNDDDDDDEEEEECFVYDRMMMMMMMIMVNLTMMMMEVVTLSICLHLDNLCLNGSMREVHDEVTNHLTGICYSTHSECWYDVHDHDVYFLL